MNTKIYAGAGSCSTRQNLPGRYDVGKALENDGRSLFLAYLTPMVDPGLSFARERPLGAPPCGRGRRPSAS